MNNIPAFDPNKPHETVSSGVPAFDPSQDYETLSTNDAGPLAAAGRGAVQGATMGFRDELAGAGSAAVSIFGDESMADAYTRSRDESRQLDQLARQNHPVAYGVGEFGGGIAPMLVPGLGPVAGASRLANAGRMALGAGINAAGLTDANPLTQTSQFATDVGTGVTLGMALGQLTGSVGKTLGKWAQSGEMLQNSALKAGNVLFDVPEEYGRMMLKPSTAAKIANPASEWDIADGISSIANKLGKEAKRDSEVAISHLSDDPTSKSVSATALKKKIENMMLEKRIAILDGDGNVQPSNLAPASYEVMQRAIREIDLRRGGNPGKRLSELELKRYIQDLDQMINWGDADLKSSNGLLRNVRRMADQRLKKGNQAYADAMPNVDYKMRMLDKLKKDFNLSPSGRGGLEASDTTINKVKNMYDAHLNAKRPKALDNLGKASMTFGEDPVEDAMVAHVAGRTNTGVANGSRNTMIGTVLGTLIGGPVGTAIGAGAGYLKDKYGRAAGKALLSEFGPALSTADRAIAPVARNMANAPYVGEALSQGAYGLGRQEGAAMGVHTVNLLRGALGDKADRLSGTKYEAPMMQAATQSPQKAAIANYLLAQRDPEYARILAEEPDEEQRRMLMAE